MYKVIALIGEAGSGKDTILNAMERKGRDYNFPFNKIISYTTRPKREGEVNGINYYYVSDEEFKNLIDDNKMFEYTEFNNWFYGTGIESLDSNKINIGVFNPAGIENLLKIKEIDLRVFYITVPTKERLIRQLTREDNPNIDEIIRRYQTDKKDFSSFDFEYITIWNRDIDDIENVVYKIIAIGALSSSDVWPCSAMDEDN